MNADWPREVRRRADGAGVMYELPVLKLQVHPRAGKQAGFLAGRDEVELRWMATQLRRALRVSAPGNMEGAP